MRPPFASSVSSRRIRASLHLRLTNSATLFLDCGYCGACVRATHDGASMIRSPRLLVFALGYAAICMSIASSLGMLLVPAVAAEFDIPVAAAQWMLTVNMLAGAVVTP